MKTTFPRFAVVLENFGTDTCGNPIARHTVYGVHNVTGVADLGPVLYQTRRRQQVGYSGNRNDWAGSALRHAGAPNGLKLAHIEGSRSEGDMRLIYAPA
jgi:hypothetical protein